MYKMYPDGGEKIGTDGMRNKLFILHGLIRNNSRFRHSTNLVIRSLKYCSAESGVVANVKNMHLGISIGFIIFIFFGLPLDLTDLRRKPPSS